MLAAGADPNYVAPDGFPALVAAALSGRPDRVELLGVLVSAGADLAARGFNDWTPLHAAASVDDPEAVALLLAAGADPSLRTSIDDLATALEEAERFGNTRAAAVLRGGT
jgi:ankyrin repeat protein